MKITFDTANPGSARQLLYKAVAIAVLIYVAFVVREIWIPILIAFLVAAVLDPVVDRMEAKGHSRTRATALIFGGSLLALILLVAALTPSAISQVSTLQGAFGKYFPDPSRAGVATSFHKMGASQGVADFMASAVDQVRTSIQQSSGKMTETAAGILGQAIWIVIIPILVFYALLDFHLILAKALILVPTERREGLQHGLHEVTGIFGNYLRGLALVSLLNGIATGILLAVLHVPGALFIGVFAALFYGVPYLGALLTLLITAIVAFVGGGPTLLASALLFSIVLHQLLFDQIISPRILGNHVGLHPILSVIALLMGNLLLGLVGMVLAVPVAACIQLAVVTLQPKLAQEIEVTAVATDVDPTDAHAEAHGALLAAVDHAEQQHLEDHHND